MFTIFRTIYRNKVKFCRATRNIYVWLLNDCNFRVEDFEGKYYKYCKL